MKKPTQNRLPTKRLKAAGWSPEGSAADVFWLEVPYENLVVGFITTPMTKEVKASSMWTVQTYIGTLTQKGEMFVQDLEPVSGRLDYVLAIGKRAQLFLADAKAAQKK